MAKAKKTETAAQDAAPATRPLEMIPLAKLALAPENARHDVQYDPEGIKALAAAIAEAKRLLTPLNVYRDRDGAKVWDGGRRLAALAYLVAKKKLPAELKAGIPCLVDPDAETARLHSLATFVREDMHPADEFLAYKALFDQGLDHQKIAAACAVPTPRVRQLLRLAGVAPEIFDAFKTGELALDVVEAFTLTDSHDRQRQLLEAMTAAHKVNQRNLAWWVRQQLREGSLASDSTVATFVGREAYEAAGGTFLRDLFEGDPEDADWADAELAKRLFEEKLQGEMDKVCAEGWARVAFLDQQARYVGTWSKGLTQEPNMDGLYTGEGDYAPEILAQGTAFLWFDYKGELTVRRGYVPEKKVTATAQDKPTAKADPERFGFSHLGHLRMTSVATEATRVGLLRAPDVAYDALLTQLAWATLKQARDAYSRYTASTLIPDHPRRQATVEGSDELTAARKRWNAALITFAQDSTYAGFCDAVSALSPEDKAELLAFCFAETLDATEQKIDHRNAPRWTHLGWMAQRAGVDVAAHWTPDADFLKGASRPALEAALRELDPERSDVSKLKKGQLVKIVAAKAQEARWTPKLLQELTTVADLPQPSSSASPDPNYGDQLDEDDEDFDADGDAADDEA